MILSGKGGEAMGRTSSTVKNRYNKKVYDDLRVVVPKGRKEDIENHAKEHGKSVNGLINDLLRADIGMTEEQWKAKEWKDGGSSPVI